VILAGLEIASAKKPRNDNHKTLLSLRAVFGEAISHPMELSRKIVQSSPAVEIASAKKPRNDNSKKEKSF
jgi:hypothetical protein